MEYNEAGQELPNLEKIWQERSATIRDINQFDEMLQDLTYVSSTMMDDDKMYLICLKEKQINEGDFTAVFESTFSEFVLIPPSLAVSQ